MSAFMQLSPIELHTTPNLMLCQLVVEERKPGADGGDVVERMINAACDVQLLGWPSGEYQRATLGTTSAHVIAVR